VSLLDPIFIGQLVIGGLLAGALYALLACGLNMVFGVMRVINVAHAEFMLVGSFAAYVLYRYLHIHPFVSVVIAAVLLYGLGFLLQRYLVERVVNRPLLTSLLLTYGMSIVLMNSGLLIFSSDFRSVPVLQGSYSMGPFIIPQSRAAAALVSLVVTVAVYWFLKRSRLGKAVRAVSEHAEVAMLCGIDVVRIRMFTFGLAAAMAAVAGVMLSMIYSFSPDTGPDFITKCFAIMVIGGMGNFLGAFYGGLLLGVVEALVGGFVTTQWAQAMSYLLLVLVLVVRPTGLRGARLAK
jgi:branched-chain amino acid transport system permease protein